MTTTLARAVPILILAACAAAPATPAPVTAQEAPREAVEPARWESQHSVRVDGRAVEYDAVVGSVILRDDDETPTGELFYTAYFRTNGGQASQRPIIFAYNGGPGSASFWLHMGIMGPRRVVTPSVGPQGAPPYPIEDNPYTLLDMADIVMVDPIGTGFSHPLGETEGRAFWGVDEDAESLSQFIRRFLSQHRRWNSPRYLLGESYGTTRSAVLARELQGDNVDLNGIILVSSVLDFQTISFSPGNDVAYITNLPAYAVTAWYHDALPGPRPADREAFMAEAEAFAMGDYASALLAGGTLDAETRARVVRRMHELTGLDQRYIEDANLRVTAPQFEQELLRDQGLVVGRLDARFTGPTRDRLDRNAPFDPQSTAISSAYTSAWNAYVRDELGYAGDREYVPSGRARPWNWSRRSSGDRSTLNVATDLAEAIRRNPDLEVLLINGIYDLATPYFAAVWTMDRMGLPPELRDNVARDDFAAGHMMYVEQDLLQQWRDTLAAFIRRTAGTPRT